MGLLLTFNHIGKLLGNYWKLSCPIYVFLGGNYDALFWGGLLGNYKNPIEKSLKSHMFSDGFIFHREFDQLNMYISRVLFQDSTVSSGRVMLVNYG